MDTETTIIL